MNRGEDRDDWFAGTEPDGDGSPDAATGESLREDWLREVPPPRRPRVESIDRRILVLAAVGVALLIAVLAAAGVFSSGGGNPVLTVTSTPTTSTPTTQPTTTSAAPPPVAAPSSTLKPGDTGTEVKVLQRALASLGFSSGTVDGQYGPATVDAVKRFQRSAHLTADGILGPATLHALQTALGGG
jgi:hypothetical protein